MEQKLYYLDTLDCRRSNYGSCELEYPQDLLDLMGQDGELLKYPVMAIVRIGATRKSLVYYCNAKE